MAAQNTSTMQFLTFKLGQESFGLEIFSIREVLEYRAVTAVPRTPHYMCGVINVRGSVVPVVDLHKKFGSGETTLTKDTCIIIVHVDMDGDMIMLGALADSVEEVFTMDSELVEPAPRIGAQLDLDFIKGMGKRGDDFLIILDAERVFASEELIDFAKSGNAGTEARENTATA